MSDIAISVHYDDCPGSTATPLEFELEGEPILFGVWEAAVRLRGRTLRSAGPWTETCVYEENQCHYLELDMPLERDYRLQRCFLLDHDDRILILGDTVLRDGEGRLRGDVPELDYESTLPFSPQLKALSPNGATEWDFYRTEHRGSKRAPARRRAPSLRVLPLALPEWRESADDGPVRGRLGIRNVDDHGALVLQQNTVGRSMFAPLFFDLDADRIKKQYTWRHLTVGEDMQRVPEDRAAGFRVQLGREQYLLYHSMTPPANRTVLGHNLIDDLCFARFDPETGVEALVEVQQEFE